MTKNNRMNAFFTYFSCVVVYFVILSTNETFLTSQLSNYEISFTEYDQIEYYKILGYVAGAIFLLMFSTVFSLNVGMILGAILYFLSIMVISSADITSQTNFFYFALYSASYTVVGSTIFLYIICDTDLGSDFTLICTCLASSIAIFLNEIKFFIITSPGVKGALPLS